MKDLGRSALLLAILASAGAAWAGQPVSFKSADALFAQANIEGGMAACQPMQGDVGELTGESRPVVGTELLAVRVLSGRCRGTAGWVGLDRVRAADHTPATGATFSRGGALMKAPDPTAGFTSCQPMQGDAVELLGDERKAFGSTVVAVKVASGRCQGVSAWAPLNALAQN